MICFSSRQPGPNYEIGKKMTAPAECRRQSFFSIDSVFCVKLSREQDPPACPALFVLFRKTLDFGAHFVDDGFRCRDAQTAADSHDPTQKLVADRDIYNRAEMILDRKSTRLNSSHPTTSRMPSSA